MICLKVFVIFQCYLATSWPTLGHYQGDSLTPKLLTGFGMLVLFTNSSLMEFQVIYLALLLLFSVIEGFEWFWVESLHKNIQLMQEFLKAPFLVLHFSYYTLMTFLTMLSVILLSMVIILLAIQSVMTL